MLQQADTQPQSQQRGYLPDSQGDLWETRSRCSGSSKQSTRSSASVAALKVRAKAGAAQVQLAYAEEEAEAIKQLHILKVKKKVAAATAEANILEAAVQYEELQSLCREHTPSNTVDSRQKVQNYIDSQVFLPDNQVSPQPPILSTNPFKQVETTNLDSQQILQQQNPLPYNYISTPSPRTTYPAGNHQYQPFSSSPPNTQETSSVSYVAKYLMRRELVTGTMQKFDDNAQNYRGWKSSFLNITKDLSLSPKEELDLLIQWLGPKSTEQAKRISPAQINDTTAALKMVWQRLEETYGAPEVIEHTLFKKIEDFPRITCRDNTELRELGDLLLEVELAKAEGYSPGLAFLDTARGVNPFIEKLPYSLQEKWISQASKYKADRNVTFPPFFIFSRFVQEQACIRNDPSFSFLSGTQPKYDKPIKSSTRPMISVKRTEIAQRTQSTETSEEPNKECPLHKKPHPLRKCRGFRNKLEERKAYLKEKNICFKCCATNKHQAKNCPIKVTCKECQSERHNTALHPGPPASDIKPPPEVEQHGGEPEPSLPPVSATTMCTEVCGEQHSPRSCAKICLAKVYPAGQREKALNLCCVMDEQSNQSLARSDFFDIFRVNEGTEVYTLKTCSGVMEVSGRKAKDFIIESMDGHNKVPLPPMRECDMIPEDRSEIPSPEVAHHHPHLKAFSHKIHPVNPNAQILLLLGRDILRLHKVREQRNGPSNAPFAQRRDLGWVIVGDICVSGAHKPVSVRAYKTNTLLNGRPSYLSPCSNVLQVKKKKRIERVADETQNFTDTYQTKQTDSLGDTVFIKTEDDERLAPSQQDAQFLTIMQNEMYQDETNSWVAPLPFATPRQRLPNNREQVLKRLLTLRRSLDKKPDMREHFLQFMQKILDNQQAEIAPPLQPNEECWYRPMFGVYHPQNPIKFVWFLTQVPNMRA
ncbi:uncharacterized protein LOC110970024 isoform X1 [Acanthochromis polyacanthus]|uniref:uncharacterized protein LOC110970024 isoform X1 n=1 Tax=Acanthochromis polyacanthus TaxID=80966 RepID=UPI00223449F7|nr:uncharacterized protein LOC110970024 isoform X1 [Acanthochromis polyacanthus]XP_051813211.1 uncharacterized protein LOC110970024 isoform X1 [Acanthochromis polyacanthus]XP_051813212.1 uncharacterized protein LOC110970024 isoform X1 [Acanthochromis polyacanthus]